MFLRLSIPPQSAADRARLESGRASVIPDPTYGGQLQDLAVPGMPAEGRMTIRYEEAPVTLADGTVVKLRRPIHGIADLGYGPLHPEVMMWNGRAEWRERVCECGLHWGMGRE